MKGLSVFRSLEQVNGAEKRKQNYSMQSVIELLLFIVDTSPFQTLMVIRKSTRLKGKRNRIIWYKLHTGHVHLECV